MRTTQFQNLHFVYLPRLIVQVIILVSDEKYSKYVCSSEENHAPGVLVCVIILFMFPLDWKGYSSHNNEYWSPSGNLFSFEIQWFAQGLFSKAGFFFIFLSELRSLIWRIVSLLITRHSHHPAAYIVCHILQRSLLFCLRLWLQWVFIYLFISALSWWECCTRALQHCSRSAATDGAALITCT